MGVDKYTDKKGTGYGVDYSFKGKRIRERVVLFDELIADYEKQAEAKKNYHNERYYIDTLQEHSTGRGISELTVLNIERFRTQRKESTTRAKKIRSGATVHREMACLRMMLNKAVKWELIPKNPASPEWKVWQKAVTNLEGAEKANSSIEAQSIGIAGA